MRSQLESLDPGQAGERAIELGFERVRELHVGHRTTFAARQVVMVADECLRQLEPRELADPGQAVDDPLRLEHGEIAVDAARALTRGAQDDLVDGERPTGSREHVDEVAAGAGVAAGVAGESGCHSLVQVGRHGAIIPVTEAGSRS